MPMPIHRKGKVTTKSINKVCYFYWTDDRGNKSEMKGWVDKESNQNSFVPLIWIESGSTVESYDYPFISISKGKMFYTKNEQRYVMCQPSEMDMLHTKMKKKFNPICYQKNNTEWVIEYLNPIHYGLWSIHITPTYKTWHYQGEVYRIRQSPWMDGLKRFDHTVGWCCENTTGQVWLVFACAGKEEDILINKNPTFSNSVNINFNRSCLRWIRLSNDEQRVETADSVESIVWLFGMGNLVQQDVITRRLFNRMVSILTWYAHTPHENSGWYLNLKSWFRHGIYGSAADAHIQNHVKTLQETGYFDCANIFGKDIDDSKFSDQKLEMSRVPEENAIMMISNVDCHRALRPFNVVDLGNWQPQFLTRHVTINNWLTDSLTSIYRECIHPFESISHDQMVKNIRRLRTNLDETYNSYYLNWQSHTFYRPDPLYPYLLRCLCYSNIPETERKQAENDLLMLWILSISKWVLGVLKQIENSESREAMTRPVKMLAMNGWYGITEREMVIEWQPRTLFQLMFESTTGFIMRADQFAKAGELIHDLTLPGNETRAVHEIIMGAGKSAVLVPYVVLYFSLFTTIHNIVLIQPTHLREACATILSRIVMPWFGTLPIPIRLTSALHCTSCMEKFWLKEGRARNIIVASDIEWKKLYLHCRLLGNWNLVGSMIAVMDEYDSMYKPSTSEFNLSLNKELHLLSKFSQSSPENWEKWYNETLRGIVFKDRNTTPFNTNENNRRHYEKLVKDAKTLEQSMQLKRHYGWNGSSPVVVPYIAVNTPAAGAQFSDTDTRLLLTVMAFHLTGLREIDVTKLKAEWKQYSNEKDELYQMYKSNPTSFSSNKDVVLIFLEKYVIPLSLKMVTSQYNSSFIDLIDRGMCNQMTGFSGTTAFEDVTYGDAYKNHIVFKGKRTESQTTELIRSALTQQQPIQAIQNKKGKDDANILVDTLFALGKEKINNLKCIALIDSASWIRVTPLKEVAQDILQRGTKMNLNLQVHYFNEQDTLICEPTSSCSIGSYADDAIYVILFDQKHTVGTDISLPSRAHGLVSIGNNSKWADVAQAAYRLRGLGKGHTVQMVVYPPPEPPTTMSADSICDRIITNQQKSSDENALYYYRQCLRTSDRIHNGYEPDRYRVNVSHPSLFENTQKFIMSEFTGKYSPSELVEQVVKVSGENTAPSVGVVQEQEQEQEREQEQEQSKSSLANMVSFRPPSALSMKLVSVDDIWNPRTTSKVVDMSKISGMVGFLQSLQLSLSPLLWNWIATGYYIRNNIDDMICPFIQIQREGRIWWLTYDEWARVGCPKNDSVNSLKNGSHHPHALPLLILLYCITKTEASFQLQSQLIEFLTKKNIQKTYIIILLKWMEKYILTRHNIEVEPFFSFIESDVSIESIYDFLYTMQTKGEISIDLESPVSQYTELASYLNSKPEITKLSIKVTPNQLHNLFIFGNKQPPALDYIKEVYFDSTPIDDKNEIDEWKKRFGISFFGSNVNINFKDYKRVFKFNTRMDTNDTDDTIITLSLPGQTINLGMEPSDNMATLRQFIIDNNLSRSDFTLDQPDTHNFVLRYY
jgi:hypothetical protein